MGTKYTVGTKYPIGTKYTVGTKNRNTDFYEFHLFTFLTDFIRISARILDFMIH